MLPRRFFAHAVIPGEQRPRPVLRAGESGDLEFQITDVRISGASVDDACMGGMDDSGAPISRTCVTLLGVDAVGATVALDVFGYRRELLIRPSAPLVESDLPLVETGLRQAVTRVARYPYGEQDPMTVELVQQRPLMGWSAGTQQLVRVRLVSDFARRDLVRAITAGDRIRLSNGTSLLGPVPGSVLRLPHRRTFTPENIRCGSKMIRARNTTQEPLNPLEERLAGAATGEWDGPRGPDLEQVCPVELSDYSAQEYTAMASAVAKEVTLRSTRILAAYAPLAARLATDRVAAIVAQTHPPLAELRCRAPDARHVEQALVAVLSTGGAQDASARLERATGPQMRVAVRAWKTRARAMVEKIDEETSAWTPGKALGETTRRIHGVALEADAFQDAMASSLSDLPRSLAGAVAALLATRPAADGLKAPEVAVTVQGREVTLSGLEGWKDRHIISGLTSDPIPVPGTEWPARCVQSSDLHSANSRDTHAFLAETGLRGCGWVRVPADRRLGVQGTPRTRAGVEDWAAVNSLEPLERTESAPIRISSLDIEVREAAYDERRGMRPFPSPETEPVIHIAVSSQYAGRGEDRVSVVFVDGRVAPRTSPEDEKTTFVECDGERDLLDAFAAHLREVQPQVLTGYNTWSGGDGGGFDWAFILRRAEIVGASTEYGIFDGKPTIARWESRGGARILRLDFFGAFVLDMKTYVEGREKFPSYALGAVAKALLGDQKLDMPFTEITPSHDSGPEGRLLVAQYCIKDAILPLDLVDHYGAALEVMESGAVYGVPPGDVANGGQSARVMAQIERAARSEGLAVPYNTTPPGTVRGMKAYKGATVKDPIRGFHDAPIATLDFASLYPSIIRELNLCYTTLLEGTPEEAGVSRESVRRVGGLWWARPTLFEGLLPRLLESLLAARAGVRKQMRSEPNAGQRRVMNLRQLAYKVSCNSVYGFTGTPLGKLACMEIASTVCNHGREMLERTTKEIEGAFCGARVDGTGSEHAMVVADGARAGIRARRVIYGDTDSVMVEFRLDARHNGCEDSEKAARVARVAQAIADHCTERLYGRPQNLEFEKGAGLWVWVVII